ncbi:MAG TPA: YggT family protein [Candidatus Limnocylindrales bacterium]|jgi:hypothetical protein
MTDEERVLVHRATTPATGPAVTSEVVEAEVRHSPSGAEVARRVVVLLFGIVQVLLLLRIVLLLVGANGDHQLVAGIYDLSAIFVAPFEGVLGIDRARSEGSVLDLAAVVALAGWTILEGLILAGIAIARREP